MQKRFFVTATGTDIGKTFITAALARQAKALGKSVAAYKPVMTGFDPAYLDGSDAGILLKALDWPADEKHLARVAPFRFREPLAPSMAARLENRVFPFDDLVAKTGLMLAGPEDVVLIEGIGGVMAPLDGQHAVIDWIAALSVPTLLVAGSYLGALSHTLCALSVLEQRDIPVRAVIVNETPDSPVDLEATADELAHRVKIPLIALRRNSNGAGLRGLLD